mmetsp:Transcript_110101/g.310437  ORF Transcript_110101/g.310437 Transcript_110101/m.310437 type:complete len:144 (+) Transcript_110101:82-513(+)
MSLAEDCPRAKGARAKDPPREPPGGAERDRTSVGEATKHSRKVFLTPMRTSASSAPARAERGGEGPGEAEASNSPAESDHADASEAMQKCSGAWANGGSAQVEEDTREADDVPPTEVAEQAGDNFVELQVQSVILGSGNVAQK